MTTMQGQHDTLNQQLVQLAATARAETTNMQQNLDAMDARLKQAESALAKRQRTDGTSPA